MEVQFFNYLDNLFFNIFSYIPDESITEFINKYSDLLTERISYHKGGWTAYPPNEISYFRINHSITVEKHPHLLYNFESIRLEITNREKEGSFNSSQISLLFNFYTDEEAIKIFDSICEDLEKISDKKRFQIINESKFVEYSVKEKGISLILGKDNFIYGHYRLLVCPEAYRIDFIQ